jgi:hypothetical protein
LPTLRSAAGAWPTDNETEEIAIVAAKKQRARRIATSSASLNRSLFDRTSLSSTLSAAGKSNQRRQQAIISGYELTGNPVEVFEAWSRKPLKKVLLVTFQDKAGQLSSRIGPRVDVDPVRVYLWLNYGRMPMNNDLAEVLFVKQKVLANPQQVLLALFVQWNARSYPRVHEKEITTCER